MIVLPAIDIKLGKCVRLRQGVKEDVTIYDENPVDVAKEFDRAGVKYLHMVDLDGAFEGERRNFDVIKAIRENTSLPIQLGGGIRDLETVQSYLDIGINRVIIGTKALEDPGFVGALCKEYGDAIAVSIDAKNGMVATKGWVNVSDVSVMDMVDSLVGLGVQTIIHTDISRDGMMSSPDFDTLKKLHTTYPIQFIASGGISSYDDLKQCEEMGLYGAITGVAYYRKAITLQQILSF